MLFIITIDYDIIVTIINIVMLRGLLQELHLYNHTKFYFHNIKSGSLTRKIGGITFNYKLRRNQVRWPQCVKDHLILLNTSVIFTNVLITIFLLLRFISEWLDALYYIFFFGFWYSCDLVKHVLVRTNLLYASVASNSVTLTYSSKLEGNKQNLQSYVISEFIFAFMMMTRKLDWIFWHFSISCLVS